MPGLNNNIKLIHNRDQQNPSSPRNIAHSFNQEADGSWCAWVSGFDRGIIRGLIHQLDPTDVLTFSIEGAMANHMDDSVWVPMVGSIPDIALPGETIKGEVTAISVGGTHFNIATLSCVTDYVHYRLKVSGGGQFHIELQIG